MKLPGRFVLAAAALCLATLPARGQDDLGGTLEGVGAAYARAYVQPLVNAFGADINSGLFHTARVGGGLIPAVDLYLGVKVFGAFVPVGEQTLDLVYTTPESFEGPDGNTYLVDVTYHIKDAPTIFGNSDEQGAVVASVNEVVDAGPDGLMGTGDDVVINETAELELLPGLIETSIAPFAVPQLRIGSAFGTDLMVRYLPRMKQADLGSAGFFGLGVRHSVSQYLPLVPVDLAAQLSYQKLGITDASDQEVLGARMWALSLIASKSFFIASVYGGAQLESATIDVAYTFTDPDGTLPSQEVSFSMNGSNRFRMLAGVVFNMGPLALNFDYSVGSLNVVSAGIGLAF